MFHIEGVYVFNGKVDFFMQYVRIYEMPPCKMVSSGVGMFGEEKFESFERWFSKQKKSMFPKDFLFWNDTGFQWLYLYEEQTDIPDGFESVEFQGGLYAVVTDIDQKTDVASMKAEVDQFLSENGLERDPSRLELGNIITSPLAHEILGYEQMDYYTPVRKKNN